MFIFYDIWLNILNGSRQFSDTSRSCQAWLLGFYCRSCPSHWQSKYPLSLCSKNSGDKSAWGWICSNWIQLNLMGFSFPPSRPFNLSLWRRNMILETDRFVDFGTTKFSSFRSQHVFSKKYLCLLGQNDNSIWGHPQTSQVYTKFWPY